MEGINTKSEKKERPDIEKSVFSYIPDIKKEEINLIILKEELPNIDNLIIDEKNFVPAKRFYCNNNGIVGYIKKDLLTKKGKFNFFHEYGHKVLKHSGEVSNEENLIDEACAWLYASLVLEKTGGVFDDKMKLHVVNSFDTYIRHNESRIKCPTCGATGREYAPQYYTCASCWNDWR